MNLIVEIVDDPFNNLVLKMDFYDNIFWSNLGVEEMKGKIYLLRPHPRTAGWIISRYI